MRKFGLTIFLFWFCTLFAFADYPRPPLEAYGELPRFSQAALSPDGSKVATLANVGDETRLIVFKLGEGISNQVSVSNIKARSVRFIDDDHVIMITSETIRRRGFKGKFENSAAFSINIASNKIVQLLDETDKLFPAQTGLGQIVGSGKKSDIALMPAHIGLPGSMTTFDLLKVDLDKPKGRTYAKGTHDTIDWFVGAHGNVLARELYDENSDLYRLQKKENNRWVTFFETETEIPLIPYGVALDESGLVFGQTSDSNGVYSVLKKRGFDGTTSDIGIPPRDRAIEFVYRDKNRKVLGVRYAGVTPSYAFLDNDLSDSLANMSAMLPNATIYLNSWSQDRDRVLYHVFDPGLGDVWLIHTQSTNELGMVANRRPNIPSASQGFMMGLEFKARDGLSIQTILTMPPDHDPQVNEALPAILLPHGGPARYDRFDFNWIAQYFANRGYAVVQPNFRGSEGFGKAFEQAGDGEMGGKMQDDLTDAIGALSQAGLIDAERVCIVGASYGGYAALAGVTFEPSPYKCAIAIAPLSDLEFWLGDKKRARDRNDWVLSYWERKILGEDSDARDLYEISPVNFAEDVTVPVLLLHGDDDTVVPIHHSTDMLRALERADKHVELIKLKGEDHWLSVADTRLQTLREMDRFIAEHLPLE